MPDASAALPTIDELHAQKTRRVAQWLHDRKSTSPLSLRKKSVSHRVPKRHDPEYDDDKLDISDLDRILEIDVEHLTCTAEPGVTFTDLVSTTLEHGLVPFVVPELETITIGGAVSGCSLESMSFAVGGFHDTCLEYEVITARGEILHCTPANEHALVFQMIHGSFGTLGILSKLKFRLTRAKPYVHVVYETHTTLESYQAAIWKHFTERDVDFMDGIIHSPTKWVLSVGRFADEAPYTNRYDWMKIYWQSTGERTEDWLETKNYFYRYDAGVTNVHPKSFAGRLLFGKLFHSTQVLRAARALHRFLPDERPPVTVDLFIPFSRMADFMAWYRRTIDFFPLWCVPYRRVRDYEWIADSYFAGLPDALFIDLAIYGLEQPEGRNIYAEIESELTKVRGIKTLISYNYWDEETFWTIFNRPNHLAVKRLTDPDNVLRDLYAKTCKSR
jgi:FAD/FMN-containing dehydrogenase